MLGYTAEIYIIRSNAISFLFQTLNIFSKMMCMAVLIYDLRRSQKWVLEKKLYIIAIYLILVASIASIILSSILSKLIGR